MTRQRGVQLLLLLMSSGGCDDRPAPAPAISASAQSAASAPARPKRPAREEPQPAPGPCRAIQVQGRVQIADRAPLERGAALDGTQWLTLTETSEIIVRHAASSREYALVGPAHALVCRGGAEEVLLARGTLRASPGGGARSGAMVTIATGLGTVRYGNAALSVRATSQTSEVAVTSGSAWLDPAPGSRVVGKTQLTGPKANSRLVRAPDYDPKRLLAACTKAAEAAANKAEALLQNPDKPGMGAAAADHMRLRARARQACMVAEATTALAEEPAARQQMRAEIAAANDRWRRVPLDPDREQK